MSRTIKLIISAMIIALVVIVDFGAVLKRTETATAQTIPLVSKIVWSPEGQRIAIGFDSGRLEIRNVQGNQPPLNLTGHLEEIKDIAWNANGSRLISGTRGELLVWDTVNGQLIENLGTRYGYQSDVISVSWNRDGSQIMVFKFGSPNLQKWNAASYQLISEVDDGQMSEIIWNLNKNNVITVTTGGGGLDVRDSLTFAASSFADESGVYVAAWSPGAQHIVTGNWSGQIRVWDVPSGGAQSVTIPELPLNRTFRVSTVEPDFNNQTTFTQAVAFSLSGNRVYSVSGSGEFAVWNAISGSQTPISTTQLPGAPVTAAAFNAGGTRLAYGDSTGTLRFYDVPAEGANDVVAIFNTTTRQANLFNTLVNYPPADNTIAFATGVPAPSGAGLQWVMGDWDGDGVETPGVYATNGVFYHTNVLGPSSKWEGTWFGLLAGTAGNRPVAGRFDANVNHDCIGVTDSGDFPPYGTAFTLYFTCNLAGGNPPKSFQWLSVLLPTSDGHSGIWEFAAGNYDPTVDAVDTIACRRGNFIAWTNTPPTTQNSAFAYAQYIGAPHSGTSLFVVGDWNSDGTDSFGLYYPALGRLRGRNDLDWNSGLYPIDQQLDTTLVGTTNISATTWRLR